MKSIGKSLSLDTNDSSSEVPLKPSNYDLKISGQTFLWQADSRPANCDKVGTGEALILECLHYIVEK